MFKGGSPLVIYIDRSRVGFAGDGLAAPSVIDIPPAAIRDLEVLDWDALDAVVDQWIKQTGIGPTTACIVLSPKSYFEKTVTGATDKDVDAGIRAYIDSVPFDAVATRTYPAADGKHAVAINRLLIEAIHHAFLSHDIRAHFVIPAFLMGTIAKKTMPDAEMAGYLSANFDALAKQSLMELSEETGRRSETSGNAKEKSQLPLLLGVFGVLIVILIVVILVTR